MVGDPVRPSAIRSAHPFGRPGVTSGNRRRRNTWATTTRSPTRARALLGKAKEKLGDATDNRDLQAEGKKDQSKADLKQAGEKVKDAFKH